MSKFCDKKSFNMFKELVDKKLEEAKLDSDDELKDLKLPPLLEELKSIFHKMEKTIEILDILEIPHTSTNIDGNLLLDILMDDKKLSKLVSKLKNKAFW